MNHSWRKMRLLPLLWLYLSLAGVVSLNCQTLSTRNQFNLAVSAYDDISLPKAELAMLWQPDIAIRYPLSPTLSMGLEFSAQNRFNRLWDSPAGTTDISSVLYRYLLKLDTPHSDLRLGLQRINFGSAQILRPLQWFDTLKPLDKLEQTSGVEALLLRHFFGSNGNLWLWGMLAEENMKGNETLPSEPDTPEWGGRLQMPNALGESALSFHCRVLGNNMGREYRTGFDHRLDSFVGAWLEAVGSMQDAENPSYQLYASIGMDYTLGIGSGLALTLENMISAGAVHEISKLAEEHVVSALMASYPLGLLDSVMFVGTWNWSGSTGLGTALWRRTYDLFSFDFSLVVDSVLPATTIKSPSLNFTLSYNL